MTNLLERLTINFLNGLMVLMLVEKAATLDVVRMAREAVLLCAWRKDAGGRDKKSMSG